MVVFDELRVTEDGVLIIDARVRQHIVDRRDLYRDVYITKVTIGNHKLHKDGETNGKVVTITNRNLADNEDPEKPTRVYFKLDNVYLNINNKLNIDIMKDLIFVYIETTPYNNPNCPDLSCDLIQTLTTGVTLNLGIIYSQFMKYINELYCNNSCDTKVPQGLMDFMLRYNAMILALDAKHYDTGIKFFDKWFSGSGTTPSKLNCGCHG